MMSHLSDIQACPDHVLNNGKINFVKYLLLQYPNTHDKIDADAEWARFVKKYPHLVP